MQAAVAAEAATNARNLERADKWLRKTRATFAQCKRKRENDFIGRAGCYAGVRKTTRLIGCAYIKCAYAICIYIYKDNNIMHIIYKYICIIADATRRSKRQSATDP